VEFIEIKPAELNQINHVTAVMSGKGGVGKSLVANLIAVALRRLWLKLLPKHCLRLCQLK